MSWADERDLRAGHVVGPFELLALVGRGGMARVWAARDRQTGGLFAVKMLRAHLAEDRSFRDMFFDEARIASLMHHENIAQTYELLELDGILCLVMELVDGPSLVRIIRPGSAERDDAKRVALPPRLAAKILAEAAAGLHAAHEQRDENGQPLGVIHRDVSPQNVLVSVEGHIKVTDFGVAKAMNKINVTLAGQIKGKLAYMSPEQLTGGGIDRRSDVFALGSLLYEMTCGVRAFDGDNDPEVMRAILTGEPIPPSRIINGYPPVLEQIFLRAVASDPAQRWPTARHMQEALESYLAQSGPPVGAADIAALLQDRTGQPASGPAPVVAPPPMPSAPRMAPPQNASGTRRVAQPPAPKTSWLTLITAMVVGVILGLLVLRSVYNARKSHLTSTPTSATSSGTAVPTTTITAPKSVPPAGQTPGASASAAQNEIELPPTVPPRTSAPRPKPAQPALPPNPYE